MLQYTEKMREPKSWAITVDPEKLFWSLFQAAKSAILLSKPDGEIVVANRRCREVFQRPEHELVGLKCDNILPPSNGDTLKDVFREITEDVVWSSEWLGKRPDGEVFPVELTVDRVEVEDQVVIQAVVHDKTRQVRLERGLRLKEAEVEEMSMTLKNLLNTVQDDKQDFKKDLAGKIETEIIPALDKMSREPSLDVRESFKAVIEEHLLNLTDGASRRTDAGLLRLTPTEMEICRMIQAGQGTKEIAYMRNSSFETIQTHRKNIRKKLNLKGNRMSLFMYLKDKELT